MTDLENQLKRIVGLLEAHLGDSNGYLPEEPMTPSEFEDNYPVEAAMQIAVKLMMDARATPADQEPVAWIRKDHLQNAKQAPAMCRVEPEFREGFNLVPIHLAPQPTADHIGGITDMVDARMPEGYLELNMSNYDTDDVSRLNEWAIEAHSVIEAMQSDAQGVRDAWQPIETAPKDGAAFFGWRKHSVQPIILRWDYIYEEFENESGDHVYHLTHWQPLPAPPQKPVSDEVKP